ncbi:MAG: NrsF family protein [Alphaproteobacteria bacterium]
METDKLIDALTADAAPVRRLRPPMMRALAWIAGAAIIVGAISLLHGLRPDLGSKLADSVFVMQIVAAAATGVLACIAAFQLSVPDRSPAWIALPLPALVIWFSAIGYGCLTDWISLEPEGIKWGRAIDCLATLVVTSVPLWLFLIVMLRRAAPMSRRLSALTASLAVAAITAVAMSLYHDLDATVMVLMWNLGIAMLVLGLGRAFGPAMLARTRPAGNLHAA